MKSISFINYKGGVGKSTTTYHVGCALALDHGMRVLLVDVDPQTNLSFLCAIYTRWENFKKSNGTLASLYRTYLTQSTFNIRSIIWKEPIENGGVSVINGLDLIPSDIELLGIDLDLMVLSSNSNDLATVAAHHLKQRSILDSALERVRKNYDYILIDCPPNLYLVTQNALAASDHYVVTALPDHLSTIGLSILQNRIERLNTELSHAAGLANAAIRTPSMGGIIFVRARQGGSRITNVHSRMMARLRRDYQGMVFDNFTTEGVGYSEASERALPVFLINEDNANRVADQYRMIAQEFINRIPP